MELASRAADFQQHRTRVVAISVDTPKQSRALAASLKGEVLLLSDTYVNAIRAYGVKDPVEGIARSAIFVVGTDRVIHWEYLGDDQADTPTVEMVLAEVGLAVTAPTQ